MLTIKSDDVKGRADAYKAIIQGLSVQSPNIPESFRVLNNELQSLGLNLEKKGIEIVEESEGNTFLQKGTEDKKSDDNESEEAEPQKEVEEKKDKKNE